MKHFWQLVTGVFLCLLPSLSLAQSKNDPFLDSLQRDTFGFFWDLGDNPYGLIPDRHPSPSFCSIAAVGFGLTTYLVGVERGYITREQAAQRVLRTLKFFHDAPQNADRVNTTGYKGFFYHFLHMTNGPVPVDATQVGKRFKDVELSTIDTVLLLGGILSCQTYFDKNTQTERQIRDLADRIYRRVDWKWAQARKPYVSMGWHPEKGFIEADWKGYNEAMLLYVLALASPTHPIEPTAWKAWTSTYPWADFYSQPHVNFDPLFGHQYSHIWIDFRDIKDAYMRQKGIDYFINSRRATVANRAYCMANPQKWQDYSADIWGLTACDGPKDTVINGHQFFSYRARGAASTGIVDDGTIAPTAAGGSVPFAPEICIPALKAMKQKYGSKVYKKYGFIDAFNPTYGPNGWFDIDYLGIDNGPIILMVENYRSDFIWNLMKRNPYIKKGLQKAGFTGGWLR